MTTSENRDTLVVLETNLGWMALIGGGNVLKQLTFGHRSAEAATRALDRRLLEDAAPGTWNRPLLAKLVAFADGEPVDFSDVEIDLSPMTTFQRRVIRRCRKVPYGKTATYGEIASAAGAPGAARAVGSCMTANRFPLIVPCHRVVRSGGGIGAFSAPGGSRTKHRLLAMESASLR
jgi:methylated-DNA-[protein]-cysteine S-methyltransferase